MTLSHFKPHTNTKPPQTTSIKPRQAAGWRPQPSGLSAAELRKIVIEMIG